MAAVLRILKTVPLISCTGVNVLKALTLERLKNLPKVNVLVRHLSCTSTGRWAPNGRGGNKQKEVKPTVDFTCLDFMHNNRAKITDIEMSRYVSNFGNGLKCDKYPRSQYTRIYTDGTVLFNGRSGVGVWMDGVYQKCRANDRRDITHVELLAIYMGTVRILNLNKQERKYDYVIMSDSTHALQCIAGTKPQDHKCEKVVRHILQNLKELKEIDIEVVFAWIPGHYGIPGYKEARLKALNAAKDTHSGSVPNKCSIPNYRDTGTNEPRPPPIKVDDQLDTIHQEFEKMTEKIFADESKARFESYPCTRKAVRDEKLLYQFREGLLPWLCTYNNRRS